MDENNRTAHLRKWSLLAVALCLANQSVGQTLPRVASGKSETKAQRISIPVSVSQESRVPVCEPWTFNDRLVAIMQMKALASPLELTRVSKLSSRTYEDIIQIEPLVRFQSIRDDNWLVPDPAIAVGDTHILVAINSRLAVYDKNGDKLSETTLATWFEKVPLSEKYDCGPFQPRLLYDHQSKHWIFAALANATQTDSAAYILFAVSENSNAFGTWYAWALNASQNGKTATKLLSNDLALGFAANTVFLSTNQYSGQQFKYAKVRLLDLNEILKGESLNWWDLWDFKDIDGLASFAVMPAVSFNPNDRSTYLVNTKRIAGENLSLWPVTPRFPSAPSVEGGSISLSPGYTWSDPAPQPGQRHLHAGDARVQSAVIRGDTLWVTFTTGGVDLTVMGGHVQVVGLNVGSKRGMVEFNRTEAFDGVWNFMPSLSLDKYRNLALTHYHSSKNDTPSLRIFFSSPKQASSFPEKQSRLWQSPQPFVSSQSDTAWWGQRTSIALDPTDQVTFWGIGEIADHIQSNKWTTAVGAASLFQPDLAFEKMKGDTLRIFRGEPQHTSLVVQNSGKAFAPRTRLAVYFSSDASLDTTSSSADVPIGDTTVDFINAQGKREINFDYTIKNIPPDSLGFLFFVADHANAVDESNENNNVLVCPVIIRVLPLQCSLSYRHPSDGMWVCPDSVCVTLARRITGGVPPYTAKCSINGISSNCTNCTDSLITACLKLNSGENVLLAKCVVGDTFGLSDSCDASIKVQVDPTPPDVRFWYSPFYPYIRGTISDSISGIESITPLLLRNAKLYCDAYTKGAKTVGFRLDPIDASKPVGFLIETSNQGKCSTRFDPFVVRLEAEPPRSTVDIQVPPQDHFFNLENHGLSQIILATKEKQYHFIAHAEKRGREENIFYIPLQGGWTVDLSELWGNEDLNITLSASGQIGRYAYAIFSEQPWDFSNPLEESPDSGPMPERFALWPSYPNPFNPFTTIRFDIAGDNQRPVSLKIYNLYGQLVATLLDGLVAPGEYELIWYGRDNQNNPVSSGVYFCVLQANAYRATRKMTLIR